MATQVTTRHGRSAPETHTVKEDAKEIAGAVNAAITDKHKFIVLTDDESGDEFSVIAAQVQDIKAV